MTISGSVAPGFEQVAAEFQRNFEERADIGAAFAAMVDGDMIIDVWGGVAHPSTGVPWKEDTLQMVFSGSKGFMAVCLLILIERARLNLDDRVARYWPEFGTAGKGATLVRHLVSHQAGLPAIRVPLSFADLTQDVLMAEILARQEPFWPPGDKICYHPETYGWLCGELVRRVDGRSIGRFFHEEVALPLGLDLWIGLPEEQEFRVSTMVQRPGKNSGAPLCDETMERMIFNNPPGLDDRIEPWNTRPFHAAEIPADNAIGSARSIARLYGCLARGGEIDGIRILSRKMLELGRTPLARGYDACSGVKASFGVGFQVPLEQTYLGPADAFGHGGAGGSMHAAWPSDLVGVSYVMNELREDTIRSDAVFAALQQALQQGKRKRRDIRGNVV